MASPMNSAESHRRLERSMSLNDLDAALNVREMVEKDILLPEDASKHRHFRSSTKYSFVLPSVQDYSPGLRQILFSNLIDEHVMQELESTSHFNWCSTLYPMVAVKTLGDGNCLMHAASLAMWAVSDRYQILRKTVYEALVEDAQGSYHRRWRCEQERLKHLLHGGYEMTAEQWDHDWQEVIELVSQMEFPSGPNGSQFGSLEEIHIFVLANVLRRTVVVLSDETLRGHCGDSFFPINFGGIYLPLHWDPIDCVKSPLVIAFANGHFTAVVSTEDGPASFSDQLGRDCIRAVPLVKKNGVPLPVHFLLDNEAALADGFLRQYLDCAKVPSSASQLHGDQPGPPILVAKVHFNSQPSCMKDLVSQYFVKASELYQLSVETSPSAVNYPPSTQPPLQNVNCETPGCTFSGSVEFANRCSQCFNKYLRSLEASNASSYHSVGKIPIERNQHPVVTTNRSSSSSSASANAPLQQSGMSRCCTTACKYAPLPGKNGLCERCFEAEKGAEAMAASINQLSLASATHCANAVNGCEFFGLPEHHNLCSKCYRIFCLQMEDSLRVLSSPIASSASNPCQLSGCRSPGIPALYNMCVPCYTGCIRAFIASEGRSVGNFESTSLPLPSPPSNHTRAPPASTAKKGILCVSPGCFNERVYALNDLCRECYERKSGPATGKKLTVPVGSQAAYPLPSGPSLCSSPGCTSGSVYGLSGFCKDCFARISGSLSSRKANPPISVPVTFSDPPPCSTASLLPGVELPKCYLTSGLTSAIGHPSYSTANRTGTATSVHNPHPVRSGGEETVPWLPTTAWVPVTSCRGTQACSALPSYTTPMTTSSQTVLDIKPCLTQNCEFYGVPENGFLCSRCFGKQRPSSSPVNVVASHAFASQEPHPANFLLCVMDHCRNPAVQDGLCGPCYQAAFQQEAQWVAQQSRHHGVASLVPGVEVRQRNPHSSGSAETLQQQMTRKSGKTRTPGPIAAKPCDMFGCPGFSAPDRGGLCESCFHRGNHNEVNVPVKQNRPITPLDAGNIACSVQQNTVPQAKSQGHTTVSYSTQGPIQVSQVQSSATRPFATNWNSTCTVEEIVNSRRCQGANCSMFGTPEMNGFCSRCFLESTKPSYPHSLPDMSSEVLNRSTLLESAAQST